MSDVARAAGVSTATVSRVLSGKVAVAPETAARVEAAVRELDYNISSSASALASGRTHNIGVVIPDVSRWYYSSILDGVAEYLHRFGYDLALYSLKGAQNQREEVLERSLTRDRVDGFILIAQQVSSDEIDKIKVVGRPLVGTGGRLPGVPTFGIDDRLVGREATEHLLALGHRRIGHITGSAQFHSDFDVPRARLAGYEDALHAAAIPFDADLVLPGDFTVSGGRSAMRCLMELPDAPTAVFAASDLMAVGAVVALREMGLEPGTDVSVIGVDGHELGEAFGITTLAQDPHDHGRRAARALLAMLEEPKDDSKEGRSTVEEPEDEHTSLQVRLVQRTSTGPASK